MLPSKYTYYNELPKAYLDQVLRWEGGYQDDPSDAGNQIKDSKGNIVQYAATCRGITLAALNTAKKQGLVASTVTIKSLLTDLESVRKIYNANYYLKGKCNCMPHPLAFAHLDACINSGTGGKNSKGVAIGASSILQKALVAMGAKIVVDGIIGNQTLAALDNILTKKSAIEVTRVYNDIRQQYYYNIVKARPVNQKYLKGWLNRLNSARKFCEK